MAFDSRALLPASTSQVLASKACAITSSSGFHIYTYMHIYTYIYICIHLLFIITAPYSFVYLKLIKFYDATWHKSQTIARRNICLLLFNNTYFPANIDLFIYCNILKLAYKVMRSIIRLLYVHCFCWFSSPNLLLKSPLFYWSLFFFS